MGQKYDLRYNHETNSPSYPQNILDNKNEPLRFLSKIKDILGPWLR